MGWKEAKQKYERRTTEQKDEDLIARRIWKGMGLPGSATANINAVERQLFGACSINDPLYDRVVKLWIFALGTSDICRYTIRSRELIRITDVINDDALDYAPQIIFTRKTNDNESYALIITHKDLFARVFTPPYSVIRLLDDNWVLLTFETASLVKSFGPYTLIPQYAPARKSGSYAHN